MLLLGAAGAERARLRVALPLAAVAFALLLVALPGAPGANAQSQVALTASYSTIGGTASGVADLLTYVSGGSQVVVPLTGTPTVYMADTGTQWSVQAVLNGSTKTQRWITSSSDISGTISAPLTVSFSYYHQYLVNFGYNVTRGYGGSSGPTVSYTSSGSATSTSVPNTVWVDSGSSFYYPTQLPGSSAGERWIIASSATGTGTISASSTVTVSYNHEFLLSSSYSIVGGGTPGAPTVSSQVLGAAVSVTLSTSGQQTWLDAGANYSFSPSLSGSGATERWLGVVVVQTTSGQALAMVYNGTVNTPVSIAPIYYHQFLVNATFGFFGGNASGLTAPTFSYQYFGSKYAVNSTASLWVDAGTTYTVPETVCCTASPATMRWHLYNSTTGTISSSTLISSDYFFQYFESFAFSVAGQGPGTSSGVPTLVYVAGGNSQHLSLATAAETFWADANSTYSASSTIPGSTSSERWFAPSANGTAGPPQGTVTISYTQQYLITVLGGPASQWAEAGANSTINIPEVFGRSQGTGSRVVSYHVDSGPTVTISHPALVLSIPFSVEGPHTVSVQSVTQFEVSLDKGASGGLAFITTPTVPGDSPWYDGGASVTVVLQGAWGRHSGVGERITSVSVTGQPPIAVDTVGQVKVYSTGDLDSPVYITTTSITQYEVALNGPALAAFSSITPPSTFPGDTLWYDAGSPAVTVTFHGVYSRSGGTGMRTASWSLDSGAVNKVATSGNITVTTKALDAPQFINATSVVQYQLTTDSGVGASLFSLTNPPIALDAGWYDASSPVGMVLNGVWHRTAGTGERLAGYSIDGGAEVAVASKGLVTVLNLTGMSSPLSVDATVVAQYQVVLDSGANASLYSITPTPIPHDDYWYNAGTPVNATLNGVWGRTATTGERLLSYSVDQGAPVAVFSASPVQVLAISSISAQQLVTTRTSAQFHLVSSPVAPLSLTNSSLPGDSPGWYNAGTPVKAVYPLVWNQTATGSRERVVSYSVDGGARSSLQGASSGNFTVSLTMSQAHTVALTSTMQYLLTVAGPPGYTSVPPSPGHDSYFDAGSHVAITVSRYWNGTSGVRYALDSYSVGGASPLAVPSSGASTFTAPAVNVSEPLLVSFSGTPQYLVVFKFLDGAGTGQIVPSQVQLGIGNATVAFQGDSYWFPNGTSFTLLGVVWEGANVAPPQAPAFAVGASPRNLTLQTLVYPATVKAVDLLGMPVAGAQVSMTLANGTTVAGTTDSRGVFDAGLVPLGTYTARVSSLGLGARVAVGPGGAGAAQEGRVPFGLTSLFIVVAVAAGAATGGFLGIRYARRRGPGKVSDQK